MPESVIRIPDDTQRIAIIGATGSGKTVAALWHLSLRNYLSKPWIVIDFKYDENINAIEGTFPLRMSDPLPKHPGIYLVHPHPDDVDEGNVDYFLRKIWEAGNIGVYIDEGIMVGNKSRWFRALLTQGRSKHIPMIVLTQRPTWLEKYVFTESEFYQVFRLQHDDDFKIVSKFVPFKKQKPPITEIDLPEYNSYYYDVKANQLLRLSPTPDAQALVAGFNRKLQTLKQTV